MKGFYFIREWEENKAQRILRACRRRRREAKRMKFRGAKKKERSARQSDRLSFRVVGSRLFFPLFERLLFMGKIKEEERTQE